MKLTSSDVNASRRVSLGDDIVVQLPERPTTGYRWRPQLDAAAFAVVGDTYEGPEEPRGAAGLRTFVVRALRAGPAVLRLTKVRPWESTPVEEYQVNLDVRG